MKIYQIHEYGGEWEDKYDWIVGSYLSEERAMKEHMRLEKEYEENEYNDVVFYRVEEVEVIE